MKFSNRITFINSSSRVYCVSSTGMVNNRMPRFSVASYVTTSRAVSNPFTSRNGIRLTR